MVVCSTSVGSVKSFIACGLILYIVTVQTSPSICKWTSTSLLLFPCLLRSFWLFNYWWEDWWCCQQGGYSGFPIWLCHAFFTSESQNSMLTKKERKVTLMLPPLWIVVLLHLRVGPSLYVISKWAPEELEGPWRLTPPLKGEHLEQVQTSQPTPMDKLWASP
jgi:hypothetical protein